MFRLQDNVPEVYVKSSRDFQLISRLYDLSNNAVRFDVKAMRSMLDPALANDRILLLLATRVGFFPKHEYNTYALRQVISSFPYILKNKGNKTGIRIALYTILKAEGNYQRSNVDLSPDDYIVNIQVEKPLINEQLLRDVLEYVLPIGYAVNITYSKFYTFEDTGTQMVMNSDLYKAKDDSDSFAEVFTTDVLKSNTPTTGTGISDSTVLVDTKGSFNTGKVVSIEDLVNSEDIDNGSNS